MNQRIIALVYDFDGTLSPLAMQEYTVLPALNINPEKFWKAVDLEAKKTSSEPMLVYMRLLLEEMEKRNHYVTRAEYKRMAAKIEYYPGVSDWFPRINQFVKKESKTKIQVEHFIISSGMKEILDGIAIRKYFRQIYGSEYHYNSNGKPVFPKMLITDTTKTQYLFRINKGREHVAESINEHMPENERRIPFSNIIYIGDGLTDVPCMTLVRKSGGYALAVYSTKSTGGLKVCQGLLKSGRVSYIAPADYRKGSTLDKYIKSLLTTRISELLQK